ncbi:hypothetical protein GCM10027447_35650 [Glycomyces halotolerans]
MRVSWSRYSGEDVEHTVAMLLARRYPNATRIRPSQGDGGIDILVPVDTGYAVWQVKRFAENLSSNQKTQIENSIAHLQEFIEQRGLPVLEWRLIMPLDPTHENREWLDDLLRNADFNHYWHGLVVVDDLAAEYPDVIDYYLRDGKDRLNAAMTNLGAAMSLQGARPPFTAGDATMGLTGIFETLNQTDPHYRYEFDVSAERRDPPISPGLALAFVKGHRGAYVTYRVYARTSESLVRGHSNIKVLLACRTVDLERDPRLTSLLHGDPSAERVRLSELPAEDVKVHLAAHHLHVPSADVLELLRTPLHLWVYCRLDEAARDQPFRTLPDLYEQFTADVRRRLELRVGDVAWDAITSTLVTFMSEHEVLTAPAACLDPARLTDVGALESESILERFDNGFAFFHQSYFDYLFARAFIRDGDDLHRFLAESGQFLFRRAQTRQVLDHLAAVNRSDFRQTVRQLLASEAIRFHLKDIIVTDLRQLKPTAEDWAAIEPLAWGALPIAPKLRSLLSAPGWFDAADDLGRWETWLADRERLDAVFMPLVIVAKDRPKRVAELLRPYIGAGDRWRERLITLINWSLPPGLVDFTVDLIEHDLLEAPDTSATPVELWPLLYQLKATDPDGAARLVGAHLRRSLDRAREHGRADPFDAGRLDRHESSASIIQEIAESAPAAFIREVLPFVIDIALTDQRTPEARLPYGIRWKNYYEIAPAGVDDIVFTATETALTRLTAQDREKANASLATLGTADSQELRFLACRALTEAGEADEAIEWLVSDDRNLLLGWTGDPYWAAARLIEAHSPHCSGDQLGRLEQKLLAHTSPVETRRGHGYGQYILLTALDQQRTSEVVRKRLDELQRRFPNDPPSGPRWQLDEHEEQRFGPEATKHMSDDHWLRAFRKHYDPETGRHRGLGAGHALRLAELLGKHTTEEPERFARLALRFDTTIPAAAVEHVIRSLAHQVDFDLFADVCEHATRIYGEVVGHAIGFAMHDLKARNERIVDLIDWCARSADPGPDTEFGFPNEAYERFESNGRLVDFGFNTTRGQAAFAATSTLIHMPDLVENLAPIIVRLAVDDHLAVRACAAQAVRALIKHHPDQALDLADALFTALPDVLDAATTEQLLATAIFRAPERFASHLERALNGSPAVVGRAGRIWAAAAHRGALTAPVTTDVNALPTAARLGAAAMFAEHSVDGLPWLPSLFNDPDVEVRARAAIAMRQLKGISSTDLDRYLQQFAQSAAFDDHLEHAVYGMAKLDSRLPPPALATCAKAADVAGSNLGDIRTAHSAASRHLITVVLRLYRQGDGATRTQCLDIIDKLCESNAYGLAEALADER